MNDLNKLDLLQFESKTLNNFWLFFVIGVGSGHFISLIPFCGFFFGIPLILGGIVFYFILLYKFWLLIQDMNIDVTPDKAVWFSLIPFYNFYWMYVANVELCKNYNKYCVEKNIQITPINETYALTWYIITLAGIPLSFIIILATAGIGGFIIPLIFIAAEIFRALFLKQLIDATAKIVEYKSSIAA
ncbi:MAG: hypothetical protein NTY74_04400 [Ignavibacteriae bacterium]|nr:hypothetical protein [Ignavibacteriota bacterium]